MRITSKLWPLFLLNLIFLGFACRKSEMPAANNALVASQTGAKDAPIDKLDMSVDGENDTLYIFSASQIVASMSDATSWAQVISVDYQQSAQSYRVIIRGDTMTGDFTQRIGELDISNENQYARKFVKLTQGYRSYLNDDFSWLHYGHGNPLKLAEGVPISLWTPTQIKNNWTAELLPDEPTAATYGKDGYIQIGSDTTGSNLLSPILTGVQNDSLLLLTFNATTYAAPDGSQDNNDLTVQLEGGLFEDGKATKVLALNYIDYSSALITETMWNQSDYHLLIKKNEATPFSTTIQVKFTGGKNSQAAANRVFIDNVRVFSVMKYAPREEIKENL